MVTRVGWLTARAWLDTDGEHVWIRHDCTSGVVDVMLPHPTWRAANGRVEPSVHCRDCGLHVSLEVGPSPALAVETRCETTDPVRAT